MEYTLPAPVTEARLCPVASEEMNGGDAVLSDFVEQEENSVMESPKRESSEWTDEKHSLYLKSMEASFVDQLYNSLDTQSRQTQNECSSGQFKVLQHGFWSRIDFKRENFVRNEQNRPSVSSTNPWIQHFRNGNRHSVVESPSFLEKPSFQETSCDNTEVIDQNFVEDSEVQKVNTPHNKKRKSISAQGNDQVASFGHFFSNSNR